MARSRKEPVSVNPTYIVTDPFEADINNRVIVAKRGDRIQLTPTEYAVLGRYVLVLEGAEQ